ncbi:MAG: regulatory iron-sulfur-containing complex subunit RicT [Patescibacteria group bacterium]|nr:regulatory iron-sulfur-containing complex subunit RicT [Patescibacteria group bacterium]
MKVVRVQFHPLDKEYYFLPEFSQEQAKLAISDKVVAETVLGDDIGTVIDWEDYQPTEKEEIEVKPLLRPAKEEDLAQLEDINKRVPSYLEKCSLLINQHGLKNMKLIDAAESFDQKRLTFYFSAEGRVDFRDLVKDLAREFRRKIRLQQIGVRDAAKICGDFGPCGLPLCCRAWLADIGNVSPQYIKDQDLGHRGAERLSGPCGRLKCCLRFEEEAYRYNLEKLPKVGEEINTKAGRGKVVAVHPLKQTVNLEIDGAVVEYPYLEGKLCAKKDICK